MLNPIARSLQSPIPMTVPTLTASLFRIDLDGCYHLPGTLQHCVCITLYNEPAAQLQATLTSVLAALHSDHNQRGTQPASHNLVCIVADGLHNLGPDTRVYLHTHFALDDLQPTDDNIFLIGRPAHCIDSAHQSDTQVVLIIKARNQGKLHSHAVFFEAVCRLRNPNYVYQIDTGSVLAEHAIIEVHDYFLDHAQAGAVATRGGPAAPTEQQGLLATWQYMDYRVQLNLFWPAEVVTGHLSVVPGQFCAMRWQALMQTDRQQRDVVQRYLRGLKPDDALECTMFLAEDRVVGNELLATDAQDWHVGYAYAAQATIDKCETFGELARQRRRWNNGANAGRLWLIGHSWRLLRARQSLRSRCQLSLSLCWQVALLLQQWLAPLLMINSMVLAGAVLWRYIDHAQSELLPTLAVSALAGYCALALATPSGWRNVCRDTCLWVYWTGLIWMAGTVLGHHDMVLLGSSILLVMLFVGALGRPVDHMVWRRLPEYLLVGPTMQVVLLIYSLWRLNDCSWGTKGLRQSSVGEQLRQHLGQWRNWVFAAWLTSNAALLVLTPWLAQSASAQVNDLLAGFVGLFWAAAVLAALFYLHHGLLRRAHGNATRTPTSQLATHEVAP